MNEKEIEALKKIEFFSRNHGYKLGLSEDKIGVPHYVLDGLGKQKLIFSRSKFGKLYWSLTATGKIDAGKASRGQLIENDPIFTRDEIPIACSDCKRLGVMPTPEAIEKARKMKEAVGLLGCTDIECHLLTKHGEVSN